MFFGYYTLTMLIASKSLKAFIASQKSKNELAEKLEVSRQTLHLIENGSSISSKMVTRLLEITGFEFEKAFEVSE